MNNPSEAASRTDQNFQYFPDHERSSSFFLFRYGADDKGETLRTHHLNPWSQQKEFSPDTRSGHARISP
jgi:hypothetical protein